MTAGIGADLDRPSRRPSWAWQPVWDPAYWAPRAVFRRGRAWIGATRRRRVITWILGAVFVLFVFPGVVLSMATAETATETTSSSVNSATSWMNVRDSDGVPLSNYTFVTNHGGILSPGNVVLAFVIVLIFALWMVGVNTADWMIGNAFDFGWLQLFGPPLQSAAKSLSDTIATPMVLAVAAAIGAFFVGWFIVRGYHAKATIQVVTMVAVAILGPVFLAEPLAEELSQDGLLAQGRNLGVSVAAGLNGNNNPNTAHLIPTMQAGLADNFARKPLQVWNFGHVIDDRPACKSAWTAGMKAGSESQVKNGLKSCGDSAAYSAADNPSVGQIGAGLLLLLSALILLLFASYLAIKVIWAALDAIYYGFLTIFGFAAGGFVYGPTQAFTVRCLVHGFFSALWMTINIVFLGVYVLFLGDLFQQAQGREMSVFVIVAVVEIVGIFQLKRLNAGLHKGNEWIANRFALAIQNGGAKVNPAYSGGGTALGMGNMGAGGRGMHGLGMMALMGGLSTIANSPLTEWAMGGLPGSIHPQSRMKRLMAESQGGVWNREGFGGPNGVYVQSYMNRRQYARGAELAAQRYGVDTVLGAASAVQGVMDAGGTLDAAYGAMLGAGFTDEEVMFNAIRSHAIVGQNAEDETLADKHLGHVVAAVRRSEASAHRLANGGGDAEEAAADFATLQAAVFRFRRANPGGVRLDGGIDPRGPNAGAEGLFVVDYMNNPTQARMVALQGLAAGQDLQAVSAEAGLDAADTFALMNINSVAAGRMISWIGNEHALHAERAMEGLLANPADAQRMRDLRRVVSAATDSDQWAARVHRTPWNSLATPGANAPANLAAYAAALGPMAGLLRT